jgi:cytochrome c-type biogenesis protein CcmH/NrfF
MRVNQTGGSIMEILMAEMTMTEAFRAVLLWIILPVLLILILPLCLRAMRQQRRNVDRMMDLQHESIDLLKEILEVVKQNQGLGT